MIYSIANAEKDTILEFKYNNKLGLYRGGFTPNPMKICHGEQCKTDINTYEIKKGESYKIYINFYGIVGQKGDKAKKDYAYYYLPLYTFYFFDEKEEKIFPICLLTIVRLRFQIVITVPCSFVLASSS